MAKDTTITQENFDALLDWLDLNREAAGQKYEKIRGRLIRIFVCRGCYEAEELADTTINRVISKLPQIVEKFIGEPTLYFLGVADNIHREWLRQKGKVREVELNESDDLESAETPESEAGFECLEKCLDTLPKPDRALIVDYYREEKTAKIELRRRLAEKLAITAAALQVKTCRIRATLQKCVRECMTARTDV